MREREGECLAVCLGLVGEEGGAGGERYRQRAEADTQGVGVFWEVLVNNEGGGTVAWQPQLWH